jgi:hypothetical protein
MAKSKQKPQPANTDPATKTVVLLGAVKHDGCEYSIGEHLELAAKQAWALIEAGAAKLVDSVEDALDEVLGEGHEGPDA